MKDIKHYILDDEKKPIALVIIRDGEVLYENLEIWSEWMSDFENRRIKEDTIGYVTISTVFLTMDHSIFNKQPLLFETAIIEGDNIDVVERYSTYEEAITNHDKYVDFIRRNEDIVSK